MAQRLPVRLRSHFIGQVHHWGLARRKRMPVRIVLWVSGVLTLFVLAIPRSVGIGYFLIIPGIIMELAPTVFIYTATFAIVRRYTPTFLPITHARALNVVAGGITLGLGVLVVLPMAAASWV